MKEAFPTAVYTLCFLTSSACAFLLARSYLRTQVRLLLWSALCFLFLALNNALVVVDLVLVTERSFGLPRLALSLAAVTVLLFGLTWDAQDGS